MKKIVFVVAPEVFRDEEYIEPKKPVYKTKKKNKKDKDKDKELEEEK